VTEAATVERDEKLRLFLALELPAATVDSLATWGRRHLAGSRVLESFHVTLAFLGARPRSELDGILGALSDAAAATRPFLLAPARYRETRSVGMLVLDDPSGEATRLAERLQLRLEELGCYRREARPWLPHVTAPPLPKIEPFAPSGVAAFLSRLHPSGARYEILERRTLEGG